ncbi:hypothetical protein T484DRAFT_1972250 [Baffinella frigidus]|nr:hypothetical protein T484DRAFT_1972250 [Cryptophyta sp. CCMP2293]
MRDHGCRAGPVSYLEATNRTPPIPPLNSDTRTERTTCSVHVHRKKSPAHLGAVPPSTTCTAPNEYF